MPHLGPAMGYWFMFPACILIAGLAISAGISGATLLLPLFFLMFPAFGVPALSAPQAIGASLALQIAAFGPAVYRYAARNLVAWPLVRLVSVVSVPAAVVGALTGPSVPIAAFRVMFAAGLLAVVPSLWRRRRAADPGGDAAALTRGEITLAGGIGGLFTGIVSAGVGEATIPILSRRSLPMPVIAATATVLVAVTVGAATITTGLRLIFTASLAGQAWPIVAFGAPGAFIGEELAVRFQGRVPERPVRAALGGLFVAISVGFAALAFR